MNGSTPGGRNRRKGAISRRKVMGLGLAVPFSGALASASAGDAATPGQAAGPAETLTAAEMRTLIAVVGRIVPADADDGGAVGAGAHVYIDRALGHHLAKFRAAYAAGLAALRRQGFADLPSARQDEVLGGFEAGSGNLGGMASDAAKGFFALVCRHTIEGLLSDPQYGGNRDEAGWKLIGYDGVRINYPPQAQALGKSGPRVLGDLHSAGDFGGRPLE